jgi:hypothetical protein
MKLLPLACFAGSAQAQSGDYSYGDDVATNYDDYGNKGGKDKGGYGYDTSYGSSSYGGSYGSSYDSGYGSNYGSSYDFSYGYGRALSSHGPIARALNCWPANFDFDTLMRHEDPTPNPAYGIEDTPRENHIYGPLHLYGSEEHSRLAYISAASNANVEFTNGEDPGRRASLGGHYHYGHHHHDHHENSPPSEWVHYHSARHAGCLYEIPDFAYNAGTWNKIWHLWYYNGYYSKDDSDNTFVNTPANEDEVVYSPNWVHFFNAHVLPSKGKGASLVPRVNDVIDPADGSVTTPAVKNYVDDTYSIKLVMANPQYEGLGWLNFVATYGRDGVSVGDAYQEFADSTHVTKTGDISSTYDTYTAINNNGNGGTQQTQGTTGNYYFDAWMGTWQIRIDTVTWVTSYTETASSGTTFSGNHMAVSSFPHNELGKDFRFNLRILLQDSTNTDRQMYYFYKINHITITFPEYVAYALVYDGRESNNGNRDTEQDGDWSPSMKEQLGGGANRVGGGEIHIDHGVSTLANSAHGEGIVDVRHNAIRDNIIPPLDLGQWRDFSFGAHDPSGHDQHHRIQGYLSTASGDFCTTNGNDCADFCRTPTWDVEDPVVTACPITDPVCGAEDLEEICSKKFHITGLLNTYSERYGGQRGTYQEIWIQLQYAFQNTALATANTNLANDEGQDLISSPFPYLHFMAYEIDSITFGCNEQNVDNGNTCNSFQEYVTHDFGWGGR